MDKLRALLVNLAQILMVLVIVFGTLGGFVGGGSAAGMYGGFNIGTAIVGGAVGFLGSCIAMSILAILLDIRQALMRIQARGSL